MFSISQIPSVYWFSEGHRGVRVAKMFTDKCLVISAIQHPTGPIVRLLHAGKSH